MQLDETSINYKKLLIKNSSIITLILMAIIAILVSPSFLSLFNITNLLRETTVIALISAGMTMVLLTGGIDLSVGSLIAVGGVFSASMATYGLIPALVLPIIITSLLGMISGLLISKIKIQPFIVTLAMMMAGRGIALVFSNERPIPVQIDSKIYTFIGRGKILKYLPLSVFIMIIIYLAVWYILNQTSLGRNIYAVGGNEKAVKLMGINVNKVKVVVYTLSGFLAGIAGIIMTSWIGAGSPNAGETYELDAIASAVIGGTLLTGGSGHITGTLTGALIMTMIRNVLNLAGVNSWYQWMIKGLIIIFAVVFQNKMRMKSKN